MAKVKCEYCGNFIEDTLENCDVCGAINTNHQRVANTTPKTIEELKSWYNARKLPPEETTRFFIGKNIKEPRAFGIYEENGTFTVYKNKANGQRAVRYKGTDEAYAVNELYLRLKEEILHQKNQNLIKKQRSIGNNFSRPSTYSKKKKSSLITRLLLIPIIAIVPMLIGILGLFGIIGHIFDNDVIMDYYYSETGNLYYQHNSDVNDKNADWWLYNKEENEWYLYKENVDIEYMPENMTDDNIVNSTVALAQEINEDAYNLNIYNSRNFIDAGHHSYPTNAYYFYNNKFYYFLNDSHHSVTKNDNTGWYVYENNEWSYFCDADDKEKMGDDLWYSDSKYSVGQEILNVDNMYLYDDNLSEEWRPTDFKDTSWYKSYEQNEKEYEQKLEQQKEDNKWDNDNDYDWDNDNDTWDSNDTDWDSDW